jgi:hypothetical protein
MTTMVRKRTLKERNPSSQESNSKMKKVSLLLILRRRLRKKLTMAEAIIDKEGIIEEPINQEAVAEPILVELTMALIPRLSISQKKDLEKLLVQKVKKDKEVEEEVEDQEATEEAEVKANSAAEVEEEEEKVVSKEMSTEVEET